MSRIINVSPADISLVTQKHQRRHIMLQVLNRDWNREFDLHGDAISCTINNDETSAIRRTASLSMKISDADINKAMALTMSHYIKILIGIENNRTGDTKWWSQGVFIINNNGLNLNRSERTLSLQLSDKMLDFTGDRKGCLHSYKTIVENSQRFDEVMKNLIVNFGGCKEHDITCIHPKRTQAVEFDNKKDQDYLIPYTIEFSTGTTIYEILEKLISVYPDWEIFFNSDGTFVCQTTFREGDEIGVAVDDSAISCLKISDSVSVFDVTKVKNVIEVWGKDGNYYGEARDENVESPFNVAAIGEIRKVFSGGEYDNIYNRYKDLNKYKTNMLQQQEVLTEIAKLNSDNPEDVAKKTELSTKLKKLKNEEALNIKYKGDDIATQWAEFLLKQYARANSSSTLTLISCPFFNETGFLISYRNEAYNKVATWICTGVSHDYTANTTTLTLSRWYDETVESAIYDLESPQILNVFVNESALTVVVEPVPNATEYILYLNGKLLATSSSTTISYFLNGIAYGEYEVHIVASGDGHYSSSSSDTFTIRIDPLGISQSGSRCLSCNKYNAITTSISEDSLLPEHLCTNCNITDSEQIYFYNSMSSPTISLRRGFTDPATNTAVISVSYSTVSKAEQYILYLNGQSVAVSNTYKITYNFPYESNGQYSVTIRAKDSSGNYSNTQSPFLINISNGSISEVGDYTFDNAILNAPTISFITCSGFKLKVFYTKDSKTENTSMYVDDILVATSTSTAISYTFSASNIGFHRIKIHSKSTGYYDSDAFVETTVQVTKDGVFEST